MHLKIELAVVTSADGHTTKGILGPKHWASPEDQTLFVARKKEFTRSAMGPNTYREAQDIIHATLSDEHMRIVLTRHPQDYKAETVPGKLEFWNLSPRQLAEKLEAEQIEKLLLLSGAKLTGAFFRDGLIDAVHQTIEPEYFEGEPIAFGMPQLPLKMRAGSPHRLNDQGTLYVAYDVIKGSTK